ncbi:70_t:CDS:10, partial [Scutellospora calospora]
MSGKNKKDNDIIVAQRRLEHYYNAIKSQDNDTSIDNADFASTICIGDVSLKISEPKNPELVPYYTKPLFEDSQEVLRHFRWMMQKEKLGQDIFLIGPPGPLRRSLVLRFAQLTKREIEYVALSKDCTDSDLKQRREISGGTAYYVDQAYGIEKAERNVLPILNNLLENREMLLEDGRFLVHPKRYTSLAESNSKTIMDIGKLVKVSEHFIVMALGLPVPPYVGHSLDPPLRSRFQCRDVKQPGFDSQIKHLRKLAPNATSEIVERLVSVANVLGNKQYDNDGGITIPEFPASVDTSVLVLQKFPGIRPRFLIDLLYPWPLFHSNVEQKSVIEATYHRFGMLGFDFGRTSENVIQEDENIFQCMPGYNIINIQVSKDIKTTVGSEIPIYMFELDFQHTDDSKIHHVSVFGGSDELSSADFFVETEYHQNIFNAMLIAHSVGDFCLIGEKGVGKSALIRHFTTKLGYNIEYIPLYKDMSSRDLLQRRSTTFAGDTIWENSPLVRASISGYLAVLDGIDTLSGGTLMVLERLIKEREISLPDGKQLIHPTRYENLIQKYGLTHESLESKGIFATHPAFRIVALGRPGSWLTPEIVAMFQFIVIFPLNYREETQVLETLSPGIDAKKLSLLLRLVNRLRQDTGETLKPLSDALSTRQLIRICRRLTLFPNESLYLAIQKTTLSRFLPSLVRMALEELLINNEILPPSEPINIEHLKIEILPSRDKPEILRIGDVEQLIAKDSNPLLIPDIVFHENPKQNEILMQMLQDYQLGEHLLLIGNQGVGKNKLADYFLQLLKLPREYIQLHRLTAIPSIVNGVLQYEDSPLVKAVRNGHILVVDEADKAPTYVTAVLKNLLEDGQMVLGDGRRIVSTLTSKNPKEECIVIHRNFRMIVLANRPGFPFLGNDFYREIGDVFSCHAVDNSDSDSEMFLLRNYAPSVSDDLLLKLTAAFSDLRKLVDEGLISYPYSTRELVNIVKHMQVGYQQYPNEGVSYILQNVFDFDQYDKVSKDLLIAVFQKHGFPVGLESEYTIRLGKRVPLTGPQITEVWKKSSLGGKICEVRKFPMKFRGLWEIHINEAKELNRTEGKQTLYYVIYFIHHNNFIYIKGRIDSFTEQIYSFRISTRGEAHDIVGLGDGSLFVVTTSPATLHAICQNHQKVRSIDLHEYFPLQQIPSQLRLSIVQKRDGTWLLILHNSSDNSILLVDFSRKSLTALTLSVSSPDETVMLKDFEVIGILGLIKPTPEETIYLSQEGVAQANVLSARFLQTNNVSIAASIISNLPEALINNIGDVQVLSYMRDPVDEGNYENFYKNLKNVSIFLSKSGQLATVIPSKNGRSTGYLELFNPVQKILWRITLPLAIPGIAKPDQVLPATSHQYIQVDRMVASLLELPNGDLLTMDNSGVVRIWQVNAEELIKAANAWKKLVGNIDKRVLSIIYGDSEDNFTKDTSENETSIDMSFLNGISHRGSGPGDDDGRQQSFVDVEKLELRDEAKQPLELTDAQRELHEMAMQKRLEQINMTQEDFELYRSYKANVQREIRELHVILESIEAKDKERIWLKNQSSGDVDDTKLIEGLTGDVNIYRRRGENDPENGFYQALPKRMYFVFDLSASMYRFNSHDRRLDRSMEVALMIMESFKSFEHKFQYQIFGHSGDSPNIEFVKKDNYPRTEKETFKVLNQMNAHSQFCLSGDNTLSALSHAIKDITKEVADDYFVVVLSDANIQQYKINPEDIAKALKTDERVNSFIIFIGSLQDQAE